MTQGQQIDNQGDRMDTKTMSKIKRLTKDKLASLSHVLHGHDWPDTDSNGRKLPYHPSSANCKLQSSSDI